MERDSVFNLEWSYEVGADHLGDGVYARPIAGGLVLRTDRQDTHHVIFLDEETLAALNRFAGRQQKKAGGQDD